MKIAELSAVFSAIAEKMTENRDYLISLDQQNGDGDLGISMSDGYNAVATFIKDCGTEDLGVALNKAANVFNENAPSSLGTITAFIMKGMAKTLRGKMEANCVEMGKAILAGLDNVSEKAGSKQGEKTILDAVYPGAEALVEYAGEGTLAATEKAAAAAAAGSEATRGMRAVWGRAAYFGEKSIGVLDGGSVAGKLVFEAVSDWAKNRG